MKLVFATGNKNKMREIREMLRDGEISVYSMKELGVNPDIVEDGASFYENSRIKALAVRAALMEKGERDCCVLADDSGLVIDYLNGEPGIYSARFAGEDTPYSVKNSILIKKLDGVPDEKRAARFVCSMVAILPDGRELTAEETMEGIIAGEPAGSNGFGYDPILYLPERGCTSAQLTSEEKNSISHRGKALRKMLDLLLESIK